MKKYFYSDGTYKHGPFTLDNLKEQGIGKDTLIWFEGLDDWTPADKIPEILYIIELNAPPIPENPNAISTNKRRRHGFVTAWLFWGILINVFFASFYLLATEQAMFNRDIRLPSEIETERIKFIMIGIFRALNILLYFLLIKWEKSGFYGLIFTSIALLVINLSIGYDIIWSSFGIIGTIILYYSLQLKKNGISSWQHLNNG